MTGRLALYDLTLTFCQTKELPGIGPANEELVTITLAPTQFKLLADLCARLIETYEKAVVPVTLPAIDRTPRVSVESMVARLEGGLRAMQEARERATAKPLASTETPPPSPQSPDDAQATEPKPGPSRRAHPLIDPKRLRKRPSPS